MKDTLRNFISHSYSLLGPFLNDKDSRVLMYHSVQHSSEGMWVTSRQNFLSQINYILDHEKKFFCSCDELLNSAPEYSLAITFDDGFEDNFSIVAPILLKLNIPFCIFVVTDFIKSGKEGYMNEANLKELASQPLVTIGSHSVSHPRLEDCSYDHVKKELCDSKWYLEDLLGSAINCFSYPHGSVNQKIKDQVIDAGYKLAFTSRFDANHNSQDKYLMNRNEIWGMDTIQSFTRKIHGSYDWMKFRD